MLLTRLQTLPKLWYLCTCERRIILLQAWYIWRCFCRWLPRLCIQVTQLSLTNPSDALHHGKR